ncbi:MAG: phospho-N-acetylmuramoyl-pentapeptide-transferase [Oscillospiraceae bacterium]|nr:phospho-N-acetylmuramoyl-pentapeptide-transferase [Oscillospiraceae bacterium]
MLYEIITESQVPYLISGAAAFLLTLFGLVFGRKFLPKDQGREFAVNGALSRGKARGAGLILIIALIVAGVLFIPLSLEYVIYFAALFFEMLSGYLDDASEKPWGEAIKGVIDFVIAIAVSVTVYLFHGGDVSLAILGVSFTMPAWLYILLGVILIWASINVTNCADGVDGLCTSLSMVTLASSMVLLMMFGGALGYAFGQPDAGMGAAGYLVWMSLFVLAAYLWFNCSPSSMLMGDAGSRALGLLIALAFMMTGDPFLFIPCALLLIIDGGLGLVKLTVLRVTPFKNFMKNIRTPIHDHARKNKGWSDTQVVTRFTLLQMLLSVATVMLAAVGTFEV